MMRRTSATFRRGQARRPALGAWRPHILLSARSVAEKNIAGVRAALAHEWAHIRHGDLWLLALERLPAQLLSQYVQQVGLDEQPCAEVLLCALVGNAPVLHREAEAALVDTTPVRVERPLEVGHALHPIDRRFAGNLDVLRPRHGKIRTGVLAFDQSALQRSRVWACGIRLATYTWRRTCRYAVVGPVSADGGLERRAAA